MAEWIDTYKNLIKSSHQRFSIVIDTDQLFDFEELHKSLIDDGFQILFARTDFDVRIQYELIAKSVEGRILIVVPVNYEPLPDMLVNSLFRNIGLKQLFPHLDATALRGLDYRTLCLLSQIKLYEDLGNEKTLKFLLENLYNIDFETLHGSNQKERILNALIIIFFDNKKVNQPITNLLSGLANQWFPELVIKGLSKTELIRFLSEKWANYLSNGKNEIRFEDNILSKNFGYLFVTGHLNAIKISPERFNNLPKVLKIGAFIDKNHKNDEDLEAYTAYIEQQTCIISDSPDDWFSLMNVLSKAKIKALNSLNIQLTTNFHEIETHINARFQRFIDNTYSTLFSLSGVKHPVLVTRILEHIKAQFQKRKVLLVIDGMSHWQWEIMAKSLNDAGVNFNMKSTLAFIPTITAWSRQAIFKGDRPELTADNSKEKEFFFRFWEQNGWQKYQIHFERIGVNFPTDLNSISDNVLIMGLVCNDLDDIMHGSVLGEKQLFTSTLQWIEQSNIVNYIKLLSKKGFTVFITSDHGNIEAKGIKNLRLQEKVGSISRGKRHLFFSNESMLSNFLSLNPGLEIGIRNTTVYLRNYDAFTNENEILVTHGGSHFWEVLVPFITIE
jgi:hypothetical protein